MGEFAFDAFISYSHRDMKWGRWLQSRLESFPVPKEAAENRPGSGRLKVFRDQTDLAGAELQASLHRELEASRYLIVICSPASAASRWVNEEIRYFTSLGRRSRIIPFIVSGEPASDKPELECCPPGLLGGQGDELLGVNIQEIGRNKALLKVVSILLDIRFNRLIDREKQRRRRTALTAGAVALIAAIVTGGLLWRNAAITRKNKELVFDIYGAAIVSFAKKDRIEPAELAFLQASAEEGNVDAMLLLADCYQKGWGTEEDPAAAFGWFRRAAEKGDTSGMVGLANCYMDGSGVEEDPQQTFDWNMKAAEAGDAYAMTNVAACFEDGFGTGQDAQKAFEWYQRAALAGSDLGMYNLARCYRSGIGVQADPSQAFSWMKKLAETGNTDGMYNLALMYQYAYGTEEDPRQAYLWYRKAAEAGYADAMRMTGWCIENSYGVDNLPLEWYTRAAEAGDALAREEVERLTGRSAADPNQ